MRYETPGIAAISIAAALLAAAPAAAQQKVKIGFITTLSGPQGVVGEYMRNSVELALDHLGRKMAGLDVEVIYGDDQVKADVGKQVADEMLKKHQVDFVAGIIWSNVMLAVAPTVTDAGKFMIGTNAGPHELAGKMCNELFFTTSWQNDDTPEAMGKVMQDQGITDVYVMAPNYAAGKDMVNGFNRPYEGRIVDEVYTRLGQTDYQAELSQLRSKNPKAVFVFYPRGKFSYNTNHFPIQNFYLLKTVTWPAGQDPVMEIQKTVFTNHKDSYAKECRMK